MKWQYFGLCILVLITLALHFSTIMQPVEMVFDEQHYVEDARAILEGNETQRPEHPPLGKLFIISGILLFGDNAFGWRFFSVICGTACVVLFYFICRKLAMPEKASLLATFLLALDNLSYVQASVAMLDVYSLPFMLGSFLLYLHGKHVFSGLSVTLGALAKMTGALALPAILLHYVFTRRSKLLGILLLILSAMASYFLLMPLFDLAVFGRLISPVERIETMLTLMSSLTFVTAAHGAAARPWEWIIYPGVMYYWYVPRYIEAVSYTIWALIIPSVIYMLIRAIKRCNASIFGLSWFACTYLPWIPVSIFTDRISFHYYFYPTVGAVCIGLGLGLSRLLDIWKTRRSGKLRWAVIISVSVYLLLHVGLFVVISPVFSQWIPIPFIT